MIRSSSPPSPLPPLLLLLLSLSLSLSFLSAAIPPSFDAREKWSNCTWPVFSQGGCGSCWAFCSTEAFSDRACISGEAPPGTIMSMEPILECSGYGCGGGTTDVAWDWIIENGDTTCTNLCYHGCAPYDSAGSRVPKCHYGTCDDGSVWAENYTASSYVKLTSGDVELFQMELMNNGPLQASFELYDDFGPFFQQNPKGVYTEATGNPIGGHCVKLMGWGVQDNTPFWLFANSWGSSFADGGYFRMLRGKNLCEIETYMSEGFTSRQQQLLKERGERIPEGEKEREELVVGGWKEQGEVENELWVKGAMMGVREISKREGKEVVLERILEVRSQVVEGVNVELVVEVRGGGKMEMKLFLSVGLEWELKGYEMKF